MSRRTSAEERRAARDVAGMCQKLSEAQDTSDVSVGPPATSLQRHHTRSSSAGDASRMEAIPGAGANSSPVRPRNSLKNQPPRIVRTFEEVPTVVPAEEWYEELECGM